MSMIYTIVVQWDTNTALGIAALLSSLMGSMSRICEHKVDSLNNTCNGSYREHLLSILLIKEGE